MPGKPSIVFAHGLWADGSCFSKVIELLVADGYEVISTQNHLNTVADDAAAVRTSLGRAKGPVVLVGHSYGGTVITAAGVDDRVKALVYICALAPEDGDTTQADQTNFRRPPSSSISRSRTGACTFVLREFRTLRATCPMRNRNSYGPPKWGLWRTCSRSPFRVLLGRRNQPITSSALKTEPCSPISNASSPNV